MKSLCFGTLSSQWSVAAAAPFTSAMFRRA
jgi:hypothetical protein